MEDVKGYIYICIGVLQSKLNIRYFKHRKAIPRYSTMLPIYNDPLITKNVEKEKYFNITPVTS